jgi:hypothetical protein
MAVLPGGIRQPRSSARPLKVTRWDINDPNRRRRRSSSSWEMRTVMAFGDLKLAAFKCRGI